MTEVFVHLEKFEDIASFTFAAEEQLLRTQFQQQASSLGFSLSINSLGFRVTFSEGLALFRYLINMQTSWQFVFRASDDFSKKTLSEFRQNIVTVDSSSSKSNKYTDQEIAERLIELGFDRRILTSNQMRDLKVVLGLSNGANFSVPGSGKTTVSLALNFLSRSTEDKMIVICPKSAFQAWEDIVDECMSAPSSSDRFVRLLGSQVEIRRLLNSGSKRFVISYGIAKNHIVEIRRFCALNRVHLVMDESHRIKAGERSGHGQLAFRLAPLAVRRDILTGTPMPQGAPDVSAQLDFLWPGLGLGRRIQNGESPNVVFRGLFVRTTKNELGLPPQTIHPIDVQMTSAHLAFYSVLVDDTLAQFSKENQKQNYQAIRARTMRLLQAAVYPKLCAENIRRYPDLLDAALEEGFSQKMRIAAKMARENASLGKKTVIWTIFTRTLLDMAFELSDLNAQVIYGGNQTGEDGENISRDGALSKFLDDDQCMVLVANPAAASEGLSLHHVCHEAIYIDRTYNAAHYLQSIDRIHRLGLPPETVTNIYILRNKLPQGVGNIDVSIFRRLVFKVNNLQQLLSDPTLQEIALAEDNAPLPIDTEMDRDDIVDLIAEIEGLK